VTQMEVLDKARNVMTPNEGRAKLDLKPVNGGDSVFRQQQDYSLEALAKRDTQADPFGTTTPAPEPTPEPEPEDGDKALAAAIEKHWEAQIAA
jgi:hypothetical protein